MGLSENSVPHCTHWLMIIIPMKNGYFIGGILHFQTYPYSFRNILCISSVSATHIFLCLLDYHPSGLTTIGAKSLVQIRP